MNIIKRLQICQKKYLINVFISIVSFFTLCVVLEVGARAYKHNWNITNFSGVFLVNEDAAIFSETSSNMYHEIVGWIPKPGQWNLSGVDVKIVEDGIRSNGVMTQPLQDIQPILAVGDSFTFGHRVADHETWPAILERTLQQRVLNAGVCGYGIEQTVLRTKELALKYRPSLIIISLIPDDIYRAELSVKSGVYKPYFEVTHHNQLILKNHPVPYQTTIVKKSDHFRKIFGYSFLVSAVMLRLMPNYWIEPGPSIRVHHQGMEVARLLLKELDDSAKKQKANLVVVMQYDNITLPAYIRVADRLISYLDTYSIAVVDMKLVMKEIMVHNSEKYEHLFIDRYDRHMSFAGNTLTAEQIRSIIGKLQL